VYFIAEIKQIYSNFDKNDKNKENLGLITVLRRLGFGAKAVEDSKSSRLSTIFP